MCEQKQSRNMICKENKTRSPRQTTVILVLPFSQNFSNNNGVFSPVFHSAHFQPGQNESKSALTISRRANRPQDVSGQWRQQKKKLWKTHHQSKLRKRFVLEKVLSNALLRVLQHLLSKPQKSSTSHPFLFKNIKLKAT